MQKVIIIGSPGSGKSTLGRMLRDRLGLPLHHLDLMYWNADRTHVTREVLAARQEAVFSTDRWIIDGNYSGTVPLRLAACDTVILLDYPPELCLAGIAARQGKVREDMPWIEQAPDEAFLQYAREFRQTQLPKLLTLLEEAKAKGRTVWHFHSREETQAWVEGLEI